MILKPKQLNPPNEHNPAVEVLSAAGITTKVSKGDTTQDSFRKALKNNNGSLEDVAEVLTDLMRGAENENVRISAAKMIATAHGALTDIGDQPPPIINISIQGNQGQVAVNLLMPKSLEQVALEAVN